MQIGNELKEALGTEDVAVIMDAYHMCVSSRGVNDTNSSTVTSFFSGKFERDDQARNEFLDYIKLKK
jgi:GTP cyclohydrolase I